MTTVYLVRHAEAEGNVNHTFQGHTNAEVTEKGYLQLEQLSERFKDIKIDSLYSSPLKRTMETARAINKYHNLEIKTVDGIIEINGGAFEGVHWDDMIVKFPREYDIWNNDHSNFSIEKGESMREVYDRMVNSMAAIASENKNKTVAVASHGCAIRNFMCYALKMPFSELNTLEWCDNTSVAKIVYDENLIPEVIFRNDSAHLSDELSTQRMKQKNNLSDK